MITNWDSLRKDHAKLMLEVAILASPVFPQPVATVDCMEHQNGKGDIGLPLVSEQHFRQSHKAC
jgi:hypothetical protein